MKIEFLHGKENNRESQQILEDNSERLETQCQKILRMFREGKRLTIKQLVKDFDISDPRRRIKDLRDAGYNVKDTLIDKRFKEYYL